MQNIAVRGHGESRKDIWEVSDISRGNFLELLHLRCKDLPWLQSKLQAQLQLHAQWTSPSIQKSGYFGMIMDETSDISRTKEVSLCLRYVINGETKETFVGFFATASTEGEVLYELAKTAINKLDLWLENISAECFDGAANMSGIRKGLATRMKECSPLGIYLHCYGHLLNLALQETMTENETLRNTRGTIQSLYNFLHGSTKCHALFKDIEIHEEDVALTLKYLSTTRWSCRWAAVRAVLEQVPRIMEALVTLSKDRDPKTYSESNSLLH
ncbi:zinc finger MYM-type protein 1-like [Montipora foliosa]|uniref:zinc finger MYM-type protein 1-like n=1 Tax=Montipora foliosa TaxID=591990 RepID=UPI0035F15E46